ncbi:MAG: four helix bundle protein [Firmicutes bacterium]|nr:four helix bundle protein [Bacillota bacterium]
MVRLAAVFRPPPAGGQRQRPKGSAGEVRSQLYVALDAQYINQDQFLGLYNLINEVSSMISGLMRYLQKS